MNTKKDMMTLMKMRHSTRKFNDKQVPEHIRFELLEYMQSLNNDRYRFAIVDYANGSGEKLGTYGFIRNAKTFIVAIGNSDLGTDNETAVQFGYDFEQVILKATDLDLKTCWLGMSYQEMQLLEKTDATEDERIVMISPVGYSDGKGVLESVIRMGIKADKRHPHDKIFFQNSFDQPLTHYHEDAYKEALEMVRIAPSAGNAQPWRVVQVDGGYDFYLKSSRYYDNMKDKRIDFAYNDLGIAKMHFEAAVKCLGLKGQWQREAIQPIDGACHVFSWVLG